MSKQFQDSPPGHRDTNEQVQDLFFRHAVDLERIKAGSRKRVFEFLQQMERDLEQDIYQYGDLIERVKTDGTRVLELQRGQARLQALLQQTRDSIATGIRASARDSKSNLREVAGAEETITRSLVNRAVGVPIASVALTKEQLEAISGDVIYEGAKVSEWWKRLEGDTQRRVQDEIRKGMFQGEPVGDIVRRIRGTRINKYSDGILQTTRAQAETLVRSSVQQVANQARIASFEANQHVIKGVRQLSTLDLRTSDTCKAYDQKVWSLPDYKPVDHDLPWNGGPPRHWRCRSTTVPVLRSFEEITGIPTGGRPAEDREAYFQRKLQEIQGPRLEAAARKRLSEKGLEGADLERAVKNDVGARLQEAFEDSRAAMQGYVPATRDYETWLKGRPEADQIEVLGKQKWELWKRGKMRFEDLVDQTGNPRTVEDILAKIDSVNLDSGTLLPQEMRDRRDAWQQEFVGKLGHLMREFRGMEISPAIDSSSGPGLERFHLTAWIADDAGNLARMERTFNVYENGRLRVAHDYLKIREDKQGGGIGKRLFRDWMQHYEERGVQGIDVHAAKDRGAYAWGKYGFTPNRESWDALRKAAKDRMKNYRFFTPDDAAKIESILDSDNPRSLWDLIDSGIMKKGRKKGGESAAKALLLDMDWYGSLELGDTVAMARFWKYVGGRP